MLTLWSDFDRRFSWMDELRAQMDRAVDGFYPSVFGAGTRTSCPKANLSDTGSEYVVEMEVPGLASKDLSVTVSQDVLTLRGERNISAPEGYSVHRQERSAWGFARSFTFPSPIDPEKVAATLKDGLLTVHVAKSAAAQPRQIPVKVS